MPLSMRKEAKLLFCEGPMRTFADKWKARSRRGLGPMDSPAAYSFRKASAEAGKNRPPIRADDATELASYYYHLLLSKEKPSDATLGLKARLLGRSYIDSVVSLKGRINGDARAREFLSEIKRGALKAAIGMMEERRKADEIVGRTLEEKKSELAAIARQEAESEQAISAFYANKSASLKKWIERISKAESIFKKFGLGIGAAVTIVSKWLKDLVSGIPALSWIPPDWVGVGTMGMSLLVMGAKPALEWHLDIVRNRLPKREAAAKAGLSEEMARRRDDCSYGHLAVIRHAEEGFDSSQAKAYEALRALFVEAAARHGYGQ